MNEHIWIKMPHELASQIDTTIRQTSMRFDQLFDHLYSKHNLEQKFDLAVVSREATTLSSPPTHSRLLRT